MDCKRVEEGVVVLGDKKKALLSFLVRDVDIEPRNQAYGGKIYSRQYLIFPHTQRSVFSSILLTATFPLHALTLPAASRSDI